MQKAWSDIRPVGADDLDSIIAIEEQGMTAPWTVAQLTAELAAENGYGWVIEANGAVVGYAFFRTCPPESELLHLVVAPERQRQGLARSLMEWSLHRLQACDVCSCLLEVRDSNLAARQLYAALGFYQVGRRKKYYHEPVEDAVLLQRDMK
nr:ribosomal protein S18-alanine N-acetyltransferase [uncultured Desulfobulbus sp.]